MRQAYDYWQNQPGNYRLPLLATDAPGGDGEGRVVVQSRAGGGYQCLLWRLLPRTVPRGSSPRRPPGGLRFPLSGEQGTATLRRRRPCRGARTPSVPFGSSGGRLVPCCSVGPKVFQWSAEPNSSATLGRGGASPVRRALGPVSRGVDRWQFIFQGKLLLYSTGSPGGVAQPMLGLRRPGSAREPILTAPVPPLVTETDH